MTQHYHYRTDSSAIIEGNFPWGFSWKSSPISGNDEHESEGNVFSENDRLAAAHPLYVIPHKAAEGMRGWCGGRRLDGSGS